MTQSAFSLIGLAGRKGAGKDTVASVFLEQGFTNLKFAGGLKAMIATLLAYQGVDDAMIERMIEGDLKEVPSEFLGGKTPRFAMQTLGTEWGRDLISNNLWVGATMNRAGSVGDAVITDVRFPNECEAVRKAGGLTIRIQASDQADVSDAHPSEAMIDDLPVDGVFANDKSAGVEKAKALFAAFVAIFR